MTKYPMKDLSSFELNQHFVCYIDFFMGALMFSFSREYENIPLFNKRVGKIFLPKYFHFTYKITTFSWDMNIFPMKRPNYPYYHLLSIWNTQRYFWKCAKYFWKFNPSTKCFKKYIPEKTIFEDNISENPTREWKFKPPTCLYEC